MIISLYNRTRTGSKSDWIGQAGRYNTICWKCQRSRLCKSYGTALDEIFDLYNSRVGLFSGVQTYMSVRKWFIQTQTKHATDLAVTISYHISNTRLAKGINILYIGNCLDIMARIFQQVFAVIGFAEQKLGCITNDMCSP